MEMADFWFRSWLRRRGQDLEAKQCIAARFDFNMVPRCAADICEEVAHMHRLGLMHRVLKLDNVIVFLNPVCRPTLKITDFGSARVQAHLRCLAARRCWLPLATKRVQLLARFCGAPVGGSSIFGESRSMEHWLHNRGVDDWLPAVKRGGAEARRESHAAAARAH